MTNRKFIEDLNAKADSFDSRAGGYRMAGMRDLAREFTLAATSARGLASSLKKLDALEEKTRASLDAIGGEEAA